GRPIEMWISLAVVTRRPGTASSYSISHHNWWPVTATLTALPAPTDATARPAATVATSTAVIASTDGGPEQNLRRQRAEIAPAQPHEHLLVLGSRRVDA